MADELKACPFCGKQPRRSDIMPDGAVIYCEQCGIELPIREWNTRLSPPPPAVGGEVEQALRELLVAVTFSEPPVNMGGTEDDPNLCYEARVPVEFVTNARAALTPQGGQ